MFLQITVTSVILQESGTRLVIDMRNNIPAIRYLQAKHCEAHLKEHSPKQAYMMAADRHTQS